MKQRGPILAAAAALLIVLAALCISPRAPSAHRVDFLSRLFSREAPVDLSADASVRELFHAYAETAPSGALFRRNLQAITDRLVNVHGFTLSNDDLNAIEYVYRAFYSSGPE